MDLSLSQLVLDVKPPPPSIAVTPRILLSLLRATIDLLIEQQITATIWAKLPPSKIWYSEIRRYQQTATTVPTIYFCYILPENNALPAAGSPIPAAIPLQLLPMSNIRREYFLLVSAANFASVILAYRPQRQQQNRLVAPAATPLKTTSLKLVNTFSAEIVEIAIAAIKRSLTPNQTLKNAAIACNSSRIGSLLVSQLLTKQIYHQQQIQQKPKTAATIAPPSNPVTLAAPQINPLLLKDDFLSQLCQELRTPLAHMKMAMSLLNSQQLKPAQRHKYLQVINTECDRQASLINGLLDLIELDRLAEQTALEPVRLGDIIPGVVSTYQPLAQEKGILLAYTVPEDLPAVCCTSAWLKQIAIHLLHNSIKFTPANGQVWVRAQTSRSAKVGARSQQDYVQLEFRDTGIGIAPNDLAKIFDRFYRVRPTGNEDAEGAGLGLTIIQQLLLRCGGSISVKSKLGEGSSFRVLLPVAAATA